MGELGLLIKLAKVQLSAVSCVCTLTPRGSRTFHSEHAVRKS